MHDPQTSFRNILAPMSPEEFFAEYFDKKPLHIRGAPEKFAGVFGWDDLTRMLNLPDLWTDKNLALVTDGRKLAADQFCIAKQRAQMAVMVPERERVEAHMKTGAGLVLDDMQGFAPGSQAIATSLRMVFGWPVQANLYCSWQAAPGFKPHFDTMDVFAVHFEGEKTWDIYATRFELPLRIDGFYQESFTHELHDKNKGEKVMSIDMKPGDVLYIPKGQYHAALATSAASLHVTFGIYERRGIHCVQMIFDALPNDPLFRKPIPPFTDKAAIAAFTAELGDRLAEILKRPDLTEQLVEELEASALAETATFALPSRSRKQCYRVQTVGTRLVRRGKKWNLGIGDDTTEIAPGDAELAEWMLLADIFAADDLAQAFPIVSDAERAAALGRLADAGLIKKL